MNFGFFKGLPHTGCSETVDKYKMFKNSVKKTDVIKHIEELDPWFTSTPSIDVFTGEELRAGIFEDSDFTFPYEFLHYYKNYDIGIPYEYEEYLKSIGVGD